MFARCPLPLRLVALSAALALGPAPAQSPDDGENALNKQDTKEIRARRLNLFRGDIRADPKDKDHLLAIDLGARQVTYPFAWSQTQRKPGEIQKVYREHEENLGNLANPKFRANNQAATALYARSVIDRGLQVIQGGKAVAALNATRVLTRLVERQASRTGGWQTEKEWADEVLPRLAEGNAEHLANTLVGLLKPREKGERPNDGVRYHALRGLRYLLALPPQTPPLLKKETQENVLRAALQLVEQEVTFPGGAPQEEVDGYRALRRAAVEVVAQSRAPELGDKDRPALTLARLAGNDARLKPSAGLAERLEAAIGLARMRPAAKGSTYNPDYAAQQIATFVADFGNEAEKNRASRLRPWKVDAARLLDALEAMKAEVKDAYVAKAADESRKVLTEVLKGETASANKLSDWLSNNPAPAKQLFKGAADADVQGAAAKEGDGGE
jgi:hypothetical protein